ncbi:ABC transporter substrate-binding protein [Deinococcus aluminii]|uniref:Heme-binding protein A n=1 Tax=Deinococcus aluminii TaxID=1656885 RepID=A0ABP9XB89_9DEIO
MKKLLLTALLATLPTAGAATLVFGNNGEPVSLESGNITDGISILVQRQIYDTLIGFKDGTTDLEPALATSWKSNADATQWTFTLRPNVRFHDGTPFNADAVVFNLSRWWDKSHPYGFRDQGRTFEIVGDLLGGFKGDPTSVIKNIVKVNDNTVRVDLNKPSSVFPNVLAAGYFGIASPTAIKKDGAKYGTPASKPVGTGPFIFQSWRTGDRVTLVPNKLYWGSKPKVDQLVIRSIKDASQRLNELKAGTIDFANDLTPDSLKSVQADKNLMAVKRPSFNVGFLSLNNRNQYLKNDKVRQAISMAINKQAIVDAFWPGLGISNASFLPPVLSWANSKNVPADYKFDPQAAKKLLAEAGYPNGFSLDLWYMPVSRPYFPTPKPIAEAMAADLGAIGIKVNLKTEDWAKYLQDRNKEPGFDMYMIGWTGDYGDPDNFYGAYYGPNASDDINWNPAELQRLLEQGRAAVGQADKAKAYSQIHEITYKANYRIPVVHSQPLAAARTYVKGWVPSPLGSEAFNNISVAGKK